MKTGSLGSAITSARAVSPLSSTGVISRGAILVGTARLVTGGTGRSSIMLGIPFGTGAGMN
ncbi:hypothetical protein GCM10018962_40490 [Dactylosporangium matsuzakiense]|uniref:Uncharacterized protein n=1 Tax=Dactylosporangium matsuzakiense TaxID=53360 RepID=A0A9W6KG84_9ACTN|nr:hypothetical protein GCM10017581_023740 [Dactylosporangium matsuzakiense]